MAGPGAGNHVERVDTRQRGKRLRLRHRAGLGLDDASELTGRDEKQFEALSLVGLQITHYTVTP